eukprot:GGOE01011786.1.p1 GENE.GGOE01011786.1~~GGOE01011786.1.p1  ORF type:complete len:962 (-),score=350.48 GGOE01011786.1:536-3421(-)
MAALYNQWQFEQQMEQALTCLRTVLEKAKNPQLLHDVPHQYEDKYAAAEFLTNTALAAALNALAPVGLGLEALQQLRSWSKGRSVTLRLASHETCVYVREQTRDEESESSIVTEKTNSSNIFGRPSTSSKKETTKIITKVTEHVWRFEARWQLVAFPGNAPEEALVLGSRTGRAELITATKDNSPKPAARSMPSLDVQLTPLLDRLNEALQPTLTIDRTDRDCHTPRRNPQVEGMATFFHEVWSWADRVLRYLRGELFPSQPHCRVDLRALDAAAVFVPVVAVFYDSPHPDAAIEFPAKPTPTTQETAVTALTIPEGAVPATSGVLPSAADLNRYLAEQQRSLAEKIQALASTYPSGQAEGDGLVTLVEGRLAVALLHLQHVGQRYCDAMDYLEDLLRRQLVAAVGRVVTPQDFGRYMEFHYRRLFRDAFQPVPFCYAVRQPQHYPEGVVCLEVEDGEGPPRPVPSLCHTFDEARSMWFSVDAATRVQVVGDHHVHAYVQHQFSGQAAGRLFLAARARQFSSFLVLVGRIPSRDTFDPTYACLLQNKDELRIPLDLEAIPTPKEFRDAIESLSPEQQRFAKAIRAMQLGSTLFGILVIQVKPQLERLLRLPPDSLTKEIQLTQDLMEMFIRYQVPSDLLTACSSGEPVPPAAEAVGRVKGHVKAMKEMIDGARKKELEDEVQRRFKHEFEDRRECMAMEFRPQAVMELDEVCVKRKSRGLVPTFAGRATESAAPCRRAGGGGGGMMACSPSPPPAPPAVFAALPCAPVCAPAPPPPPPDTATTSTTSTATGKQQGSELPAQRTEAEPGAGAAVDYTQLPALLDERFEALDVDSALRPTIITPGHTWEKRSQAGLLSDMKRSDVGTEEQKALRQQAMDLIDALSRSGALVMEDAQLHVVVAATHCFDQSLLDTVVQQNVNPVERVERSALIMASAVHDLPAGALLKAAQEARVREHSALLFR